MPVHCFSASILIGTPEAIIHTSVELYLPTSKLTTVLGFEALFILQPMAMMNKMPVHAPNQAKAKTFLFLHLTNFMALKTTAEEENKKDCVLQYL